MSHWMKLAKLEADEFKAKVRKRWNQFTDDEIDEMKADKDILEAKVAQKLEISKDEARSQVNSWANSLFGSDVEDNI